MRTPQGWKVLQDQPYCPACKNSAFSLRALILPVAGPAGDSWDDFRLALRAAWQDTTRCANWMVTELYTRDVRREPGDERLRPMPKIYLYPEARQLFPRLSAQAVAALAQDIGRRYRARRYDLLWTRASSIPTYRYPAPCSIPAQAWTLHEDSGRWSVSMRLGDRRWRVRLRGGPHMRFQSERLRQILDGRAERGALVIYQNAAPGSPHRGGAEAHGSQVIIKIAAWLPKVAHRNGTEVLQVRTTPDALLLAEPAWRIDPAPIRAVLAAEGRRRAALLTNLQLGKQSRRGQQRLRHALAELSRRSRQRIGGACRTYAAHLTRYARSRHAGLVVFNDSERVALPHFPWEELRRRIAEKLDEHGIQFRWVHEPPTASEGKDVASGGRQEDAA